MPERAELLGAFLSHCGWEHAEQRPLAGDASNRRYLRLVAASGETRVLMDAPPDKGEDVRPFVAIAGHLRSVGLGAPRILGEDAGNGFLLLEDLGDDIFTRVLAADPTQEATLYRAAADVLVELHRHAPPDELVAFDAPLMADLAVLAYDWYLAGITGSTDPGRAKAFRDHLRDTLASVAEARLVLAHRDFHAENLVWLPLRQGVARVGLLDFQDAVAGPSSYDLVSLLADARRDVSAEVREATVRHFLDQTGRDAATFLVAAAAVSAQRNLRILGVFARLSLHFGKPGYIRLIPRVWDHLERGLSHPRLATLRNRVLADLPRPTMKALARLEEQCATPSR